MLKTKEAQPVREPSPLTSKQTRIINTVAEKISASDKDQTITYSHSTLCQTSLPFKKQPGITKWSVQNGRAQILITAGDIFDSEQNKWIELELPYGPKPRLVLYDWNRQAVITKNPEINVEKTLRAFMKRLNISLGGRDYKNIKNQLSCLAACQFSLGLRTTDSTDITAYGRIAKNITLLRTEEKNKRVRWPQTITLSVEYFESLLEHAVPLDENALHALQDSALELDIYSMLAERLHRIPMDKPQFIPWKSLYEQYGSGYSRLDRFRDKFRKHLQNVLAVYHFANIEELTTTSSRSKGLLLKNSPPPVQKQLTIVL